MIGRVKLTPGLLEAEDVDAAPAGRLDHLADAAEERVALLRHRSRRRQHDLVLRCKFMNFVRSRFESLEVT